MRRILLALVLIAASIAPAAAQRIPGDYDAALAASASRWLPMWDWRWFKAQCYQESLLKPAAVSHAGAQGLCQLMPGTWADLQKAGVVGRMASPFVAEFSAEAGAYYMARLRRGWSAPRPEESRRELAQASYNAGLGHILDAQRRCGGARDWMQVRDCLPQVTGRHAAETITYVDRIRRWYERLLVSG